VLVSSCDNRAQTGSSWMRGGPTTVRIPVPGPQHGEILGDLLVRAAATGNHTAGAPLAAPAVEWGLELVSSDRDFAHYPGLRWRDPLEVG
jgi:hypothetical protein